MLTCYSCRAITPSMRRSWTESGLSARTCNTESIFDLSKDQTANQTRYCPGCGSDKFLPSFTTTARQDYNWITYYKRGRDMQKAAGVRFYFKRPA